jgi:3-oxoadipate enol-lactonase
VLPLFDPAQRLLLVDLPGHGASPRLRGRTSVEGMATAVAALLDRLGEEPVHVVGLSLGGCVGLALALLAPARVRSLVLVSAFARLRPGGLAAARRLITRLALVAVAPMPVVAAHVARGLFPRPEQRPLYLAAVASLSRTSRGAYVGGLRALAGFDARGRLSAIRCPVLVVAGERDTTVPRDVQRALASGIPGAQFVVVPGSGHAAPYDQPDAFGRAVRPFLARH